MLSTNYLYLLIGFAAASDYAWKSNTEYQYNVRGRTLSSLQELDNQYVGIVLTAQLIIRLKHEELLYAKLNNPQYAQVHAKLPDGWNTEIPESHLIFRPLQFAKKPFEIKMKNGAVQELIVDKNITNWEANMLKSIISQINVDIQSSKLNYKIMEDSVTGKCETFYDISMLPDYMYQSKPELAPLPHLKGDGGFIDIVKTKNYSNCDERVTYHYGIENFENMESSSTNINDFVTKSSVSRVLLTGTLRQYTIQSSVTTNKIFIKPTPNSNKNGLVVSRMNITLISVKTFSDHLHEMVESKRLNNLVYTYEARDGFPYIIFSNSTSEKWQQYKSPLAPLSGISFLPYIIGKKGHSINTTKNINIAEAVQTIAKQIGQDLQNPSEIPKEDTLAKFIILCRLIRTMNYPELQEASRHLYNKKTRMETDSWKSFRDAVAQAGNKPALLIIKEWIESMKVRGYEAACLIASMSKSVRIPTDEYMKIFYAIVTDKKVQQEVYLNNTAILSFTELVNKVYANKDKLYKQNEQAVYKDYIPYFAQQMKEAIREADNYKIQVYIRALGNIGHRQILAVFKPYLEGTKQISQFQRIFMVVCMDKLVDVSTNDSRFALYKLYQNESEASEIRVAAVHQLMRTKPPASMLQRMAETTNMDGNEDVSSAVKSTIQNAAQSQDPSDEKFRSNAQAAVHLLNPKMYGNQYSKQYLRDYFIKETKYYMRSDYSTMPHGFMYSLTGKMGESRRQYMNFETMVFNVQKFYNIVKKQIKKNNITKFESAKQSQWTSEQLEGNLKIGLNGMKYFYSFDNQTIEQLPEYLKELSDDLKQGKEFSMTKFNNPHEMIITFPTEMGFPFVYTLETPILTSLNGKVKVITQPEIVSPGQQLRTPATLNIAADSRAVISSKTEAKLGFITHFDQQHYIAGYDKKIQLNLPIRTEIDIDVENEEVRINVEPLSNNIEKKFHFSTWPYTATHDIFDLKPVSRISSAKIIHVRKRNVYEQLVGKKSGMAIRVQLETEHEFVDFERLCTQYFFAPNLKDSFVHTHLNVGFDNANSVTLHMSRNQIKFSGKRSGTDPKFNELFKKASILIENDKRREYFMKNAAASINDVYASAYDVSIEFKSKIEQYQYNTTLAIATSPVDKKSRLLFYHKRSATNEKNLEVCFYAQNSVPNTNTLNFVSALKLDPTTTSQMKLVYGGENCQFGTKVDFVAKFEKTKERHIYLLSQPLAHICMEQMKQGNQQLYACRNMIHRANFLDQYKVGINYQNMSLGDINRINKIYNAARYLGYPYMNENILEGIRQRKQNRFEADLKPSNYTIKANFEPDFISVNASIDTENMLTEFNNIRLANWDDSFNDVDSASCVVDKYRTNTFDNKSYPIDLGKTWYAQMRYRVFGTDKQQYQLNQHDYKVLVRDSNNNSTNKKDVKITFNNAKNYYEIDLVPADGNSHSGSNPTGKVFINQQQIKFDDQHSYDVESDLVKIYGLPTGEVKIEVNGDFYVIYDGERVKLTALRTDQFRGEVRGLCGTFDGETSTDFLTPEDCILSDPFEFAATYAIIDGSSQGPAKERQIRAKQSHCVAIKQTYANLINPRDYHQEEQQLLRQNTGICTNRQIQFIEKDNGKTMCSTVRPILACRPGCKAVSKIAMNVAVHCLQKNKITESWQKQILNSTNTFIQFIKIEVVQSCSK